MTAILGALASGHTAQQILRYLSQQNPRLAQQISSAINAGHTFDHIVRYMAKQEKKLGKLIPNETKSRSSNLYQTAQNDLHPSLIGGAKALGTGLAATAILGGGLALNAGRNAAIQASQILPALQQQAQLPAPNQPLQIGAITPQPPPTPSPIQPSPNPIQDEGIVQQGIAPQTPGQQIGQGIQSPITEALQPSNPNQIAQASQAIPDQMPEDMMPQQTPQQLPIFEQLLGGIDITTLEPEKQQQLKFLSMVSDQLQAKGKTLADPEFKNLASKIKKVLAGKPGMMIEENARFNAGQEAKQANVKPLYIKETEKPTSIVEPAKITKPQEIKKGESVITEDGNIAEIKGTSGNNFLIEENGKVRQVPMNSLRAEPEAIKKAKIVFDPSKVPEEDRSATLAISLPMPDKSAIINMFHDGSFYMYKRKDGKPIEDSIIRRIIDGQDIPISTGETYMGAWNQEKGDSRGSASYKELTSLAQDASKPDDPSKPLIFEKITDQYTHGYLKEFMKLLKETGKNFSAKPKKIKK